MVDKTDLNNLSARLETFGVEFPKFGEPFNMGIPSEARKWERVETRRGAPVKW